jgi:hypothetical protein
MTYGTLRLIAGFTPPSRLLRALLFLLIGACFAAGLPARDAHAAIPASSPSPGAAALTPADAGQLLSVLNDPAKLAALGGILRLVEGLSAGRRRQKQR